MKKIYLLSFVFFLHTFVISQVVEITKTSVSGNGKSSDFEIILESKIKNLTSNPLEIKWVRTQKNITTGWESSMCDKEFCYFPQINEGTFMMEGGELAKMDAYFYPESIAGAGNITTEIFVKIGTLFEKVGSITYSVTTDDLVSFKDVLIAKTKLNVFPNPAKSVINIQLENLKDNELKIFNLNGVLVKSERLYSLFNVIDIADVEKGVYQLSLGNSISKLVVE